MGADHRSHAGQSGRENVSGVEGQPEDAEQQIEPTVGGGDLCRRIVPALAPHLAVVQLLENTLKIHTHPARSTNATMSRAFRVFQTIAATAVQATVGEIGPSGEKEPTRVASRSKRSVSQAGPLPPEEPTLVGALQAGIAGQAPVSCGLPARHRPMAMAPILTRWWANTPCPHRMVAPCLSSSWVRLPPQLRLGYLMRPSKPVRLLTSRRQLCWRSAAPLRSLPGGDHDGAHTQG